MTRGPEKELARALRVLIKS